MLVANRGVGLESSSGMITTTTITTESTSPSAKRRHHEREDGADVPRKRRQTNQESNAKAESLTSPINASQGTLQVLHQEVLLLHGVKQRYTHTLKYEIPKARDDSEMLVKVTVVGLNPIDWKAP